MGWTHALIDPMVLQAERVLRQRQARNLIIDPDLLGEPGWDILLYTFIEWNNERECRIEGLSNDLQLSLPMAHEWVERLVSSDMLVESGLTIQITPQAHDKMHTMLSAYARERLQEFGGGDENLHFCSGMASQND